MLRMITHSAGRFEAGNTHDYPRGVWEKIAADLRKDPRNKALFSGVKPGDTEGALKAFSEPQEFNPGHQSVTRGKVEQRTRLGAPARPKPRLCRPVRVRRRSDTAMLKNLMSTLLALLGAYASAALAMHIGPTPIEVLHRPLFRSAPLVRINSHAAQYAGRTTLSSGSASVTVSTAAVNSDSLLNLNVQMTFPAAYLPRGQTTLASGATSGVASTSAIYSGMNVQLTAQNLTSQLSGSGRSLRVSSIVDGVSFLIATVDSLQVQGTTVAMWDIPEAKAIGVKVNSIVSGGYFSIGWGDERPRPRDATVMWELRRAT